MDEKEQTQKRIELLRRELKQQQRKLKKVKRLEKVREHVKKKVREQTFEIQSQVHRASSKVRFVGDTKVSESYVSKTTQNVLALDSSITVQNTVRERRCNRLEQSLETSHCMPVGVSYANVQSPSTKSMTCDEVTAKSSLSPEALPRNVVERCQLDKSVQSPSLTTHRNSKTVAPTSSKNVYGVELDDVVLAKTDILDLFIKPSAAAHHNTNSTTADHNADSTTAHHNTNSTTADHNADPIVDDHNTGSTAADHNVDSKVADHNTGSTAADHNADSKVADHNTGSTAADHNADSKVADHNTGSTAADHNADSAMVYCNNIDSTAAAHDTDFAEADHNADSIAADHHDFVVADHTTVSTPKQPTTTVPQDSLKASVEIDNTWKASSSCGRGSDVDDVSNIKRVSSSHRRGSDVDDVSSTRRASSSHRRGSDVDDVSSTSRASSSHRRRSDVDDVSSTSRASSSHRRRSDVNVLDFSFLDDKHDMYSMIKQRRRSCPRVGSSTPVGSYSEPVNFRRTLTYASPDIGGAFTQDSRIKRSTVKAKRKSRRKSGVKGIVETDSAAVLKQSGDINSNTVSRDLSTSSGCRETTTNLMTKAGCDREREKDDIFSFPDIVQSLNDIQDFELPAADFGAMTPSPDTRVKEACAVRAAAQSVLHDVACSSSLSAQTNSETVSDDQQDSTLRQDLSRSVLLVVNTEAKSPVCCIPAPGEAVIAQIADEELAACETQEIFGHCEMTIQNAISQEVVTEKLEIPVIDDETTSSDNKQQTIISISNNVSDSKHCDDACLEPEIEPTHDSKEAVSNCDVTVVSGCDVTASRRRPSASGSDQLFDDSFCEDLLADFRMSQLAKTQTTENESETAATSLDELIDDRYVNDAVVTSTLIKSRCSSSKPRRKLNSSGTVGRKNKKKMTGPKSKKKLFSDSGGGCTVGAAGVIERNDINCNDDSLVLPAETDAEPVACTYSTTVTREETGRYATDTSFLGNKPIISEPTRTSEHGHLRLLAQLPAQVLALDCARMRVKDVSCSVIAAVTENDLFVYSSDGAKLCSAKAHQGERFESVCCVALDDGMAIVTQATDGTAVILNSVIFSQHDATNIFLQILNVFNSTEDRVLLTSGHCRLLVCHVTPHLSQVHAHLFSNDSDDHVDVDTTDLQPIQDSLHSVCCVRNADSAVCLNDAVVAMSTDNVFIIDCESGTLLKTIRCDVHTQHCSAAFNQQGLLYLVVWEAGCTHWQLLALNPLTSRHCIAMTSQELAHEASVLNSTTCNDDVICCSLISGSMYVWDVSTGMLVADVINDLPGMSSSPASTVKSPTKHVCDISDVFDGSVHATDKSMVELKNAGIMTSPQQGLRKLSTAQNNISLLGHDVMVARDTRIYRCDCKKHCI